MTPPTVDLVVDLNTMDDTGLPWAFLDEVPDPGRPAGMSHRGRLGRWPARSRSSLISRRSGPAERSLSLSRHCMRSCSSAGAAKPGEKWR